MSVLDRVVAAAKRSPEGALLFAAGCALLMRGVGAAAHRLRGEEDLPRATGRARRRGRHPEEDDARGLFGVTRAYASDVAGRMAHSAEEAVSYADDARRAAAQRTGEAMRGVRGGASDAVDRMLAQQPLTVGLIGIAAGALIAAALPGSRVERRAFAPVGERIGEAADDARRRLKRAADRTRRRAAEVAEEHGLTPDGLKEAALDVAEAFSDEFMSVEKPAAGRGQAGAGTQKKGASGGRAKAGRGKAAASRSAKRSSNEKVTENGVQPHRNASGNAGDGNAVREDDQGARDG
ncbi:MAG: hypothetical protein IT533_05105 [Hyphomicrobiales bacterium]|jgi:hypothetical protein|nr:hypothetical protein [Hyphomicrobiales bacterium]